MLKINYRIHRGKRDTVAVCPLIYFQQYVSKQFTGQYFVEKILTQA